MAEPIEKRLQGAPVSEGSAMGKIFVLAETCDESIPEFIIKNSEEIEEHISRFHSAVKHSQTDLEDLYHSLERQGNTEAAMVIDAHIQMLQDPMISEAVVGGIRSTKRNVEAVFSSVIKTIKDQISLAEDHFFQERSIDVADVSMRIMNYLRKNATSKCEHIPPGSIVVVKQLIPSQVAAFEREKVVAIISEHGGGSCHAALIARSKGIPYVTRVDISSLIEAGQEALVFVDGSKGTVILHPKQEGVYASLEKTLPSSLCNRQEKDQTEDGTPIQVFANISDVEDAGLLKENGLSGIGLFRSEYLFLQDKTLLLSENGQYELYKYLVEQAKGLPVVIRVLDVGGDKDPGYFLHDKERYGSQICERGIRFLLKNKKLFLTQLRALLRAAVHGDLRILLPFVSDIQEIFETKELIQQAASQLAQKGRMFCKQVPLGSMIEVPAAVMICDLIAEHCSFLSIGTNDLYQFTTGIDRSEAIAVSGVFPFPPSLMRMLKTVADTAKSKGVTLSICGEIASDPFFIPLLIGLGITNLSCALRFVPRVKEAIGKLQLERAESLVQKMSFLKTAHEIREALSAFFKDQMEEETWHSWVS